MRGLDPRIHLYAVWFLKMDGRVEPGHDEQFNDKQLSIDT
jgi:hypothetical protein